MRGSKISNFIGFVFATITAVIYLIFSGVMAWLSKDAFYAWVNGSTNEMIVEYATLNWGDIGTYVAKVEPYSGIPFLKWVFFFILLAIVFLICIAVETFKSEFVVHKGWSSIPGEILSLFFSSKNKNGEMIENDKIIHLPAEAR